MTSLRIGPYIAWFETTVRQELFSQIADCQVGAFDSCGGHTLMYSHTAGRLNKNLNRPIQIETQELAGRNCLDKSIGFCDYRDRRRSG